MDGWGEVSRIPATSRTSSPPGKEAPHISSLVFDNTTNLIWCGDSSGTTTSFMTPQHDPAMFSSSRHVPLYQYTKFRTSNHHNAISQLLNHSKGMLSLSSSSISFNNRRGLPLAMFSSSLLTEEDSHVFRNLTCMTLAYSTSSDLIVGGASSLFKLDLVKPGSVQPFSHKGDLSLINYTSKILTLGTTTGSLEIFDPVANKTVKSFPGHSGLLSDLDVKGNYVATCGYSARASRRAFSSVEYMMDPLVNIYDVRTMKALSPVPFSAGASFVRFHPKLPNIIVIASSNGQLQFVDIYDSSVVHLYQADLSNPSSMMSTSSSGAYLSNLSISENGEYLCFGDSNKNLHLWSMSTSTSQNFLNFPAALEQPDTTENIVFSTNCMSLDADTPLNTVGMPYYKEYLASNFPNNMVFTKETARIPPDIFAPDHIKNSYSKMPESTGEGYSKNRSRYVVPKYKSLKRYSQNYATKNSVNSNRPKFISERQVSSPGPSSSRFPQGESPSLASFPILNESNDQDFNAFSNDANINETSGTNSVFQFKSPQLYQVPRCYSKLEIRYSRFGVDDFDFDYYNLSKGSEAGLENHLDNSYTNSLLQIYRHVPIFYNAVVQSLLNEYLPNDKLTIKEKSNPQGSSVLNELAYLFDMMSKAGSKNVNISNFSSILNESSIAKTHNLLNKDDCKSLDAYELQILAVTFNKFLVESVVNDYESQFGVNIQNLTAMHYEVDFVAPSGESLNKQYGNQATLDLISPPLHLLDKSGSTLSTFSRSGPQLLKQTNILTYIEHSLNQRRMLPPTSNTPFEVEVRQSLIDIGSVLSINMAFEDNEFDVIRSIKQWLVPHFYVTTGPKDKGIVFKQSVPVKNQLSEKYQLQGYVCEINNGSLARKGRHNLVSFVKVKSPASARPQWFLFNDFLVMPLPEEEVLNLSYRWKRPSVVIYTSADDPKNQEFSKFDYETFQKIANLNDSILYRDHFAYSIRETHKKEYELLTRSEAPHYGSLVAIDAEFVALRREIAEVSYTGAKHLVRPTLLSLARVSALRGDPGPKHGVPFIDDYILHCKPIKDYLTMFSGIEEGDLDPEKSTKTLVTLQTAYRRLWLLLNLGCVFVGHGLQSDFRCINLQVPKSQIRDTIEFYFMPDFKRKLSLKFLAYSVLKEAVQTRNHDSIEDANTALLLFEKYMELKAAGEFEQTLRNIYSEGQSLRFRVPE